RGNPASGRAASALPRRRRLSAALPRGVVSSFSSPGQPDTLATTLGSSVCQCACSLEDGNRLAGPIRSSFTRRPRVFGVRHELAPEGFLAFGRRLPDGQMGHEVVWRGAVPMPLAGGSLDRVACPNLQHAAPASLDEPDPIEDVKRLTACVRMPPIARPGREPHDAYADLGRWLTP